MPKRNIQNKTRMPMCQQLFMPFIFQTCRKLTNNFLLNAHSICQQTNQQQIATEKDLVNKQKVIK